MWVWVVVSLVASAGVLSSAEARTAPLRVTSVRFWSLGDTTRVAIETNGEFSYKHDRLRDPDRLFFDLIGVKPAQGTDRIHIIPVGDGILKQIRVAETEPGKTRVVLDLDAAAEYKASHLTTPERLVVEVRRRGAGPVPVISQSRTGVQHLTETPAPPPAAFIPAPKLKPKLTPRPFTLTEAPRKATQRHTALPPPPTIAYNIESAPYPGFQALSTRPAPPVHAAPKPVVASAKPKPLPPPAAVSPASPAKQNLDGGRSLTRALGLKVGRVVLDPGHGGHDTGTIGPGGVLEKDLVLDIALRLGPLIEQGLGSAVVYTRKDDTFVSLEDRTLIANEAKADLFLSIHVNSSRYRAASGSETYYLNFTTSGDALDVAARENATSSKTIHELQDLIKKIALLDKVEESKEFASRLQSSLYVLSSKNGTTKNRGVKKAPFVVLIGAAMPSVLTEVGFVTNPREGTLLKRADQRQKIAEALYQGLSSYASTLSHFQVAHRSTGE
ncbi:MAG: N-acetylmuramoyl-L-alanine amidase [Acidobacteriales bacterium]|nr:N-acetylmuramoyl-L-alanine amidase [Terriglobales bacterium]